MSASTRQQDRHQARELAMQALYEADVAGHPAAAVLERLLGEAAEAYRPLTVAFAGRLLVGVEANLGPIDEQIAATAPAWPLEQMAKIDKSILRLAIYEILFGREAPYKAAINEAVELAKRYGSDSSPRFVNGVLGTVAARRPADPAPEEGAAAPHGGG